MPVSLVKDLSPEGHSGQRKLQDVVGSIAMLTGIPGKTALPENREK